MRKYSKTIIIIIAHTFFFLFFLPLIANGISPYDFKSYPECAEYCQQRHRMKMHDLLDKANAVETNWAHHAEDLFFKSYENDEDEKAKQKWDELVVKTQKGRNKYRKSVIKEIKKLMKCLDICEKQERRRQRQERRGKDIPKEDIKLDNEGTGETNDDVGGGEKKKEFPH